MALGGGEVLGWAEIGNVSDAMSGLQRRHGPKFQRQSNGEANPVLALVEGRAAWHDTPLALSDDQNVRMPLCPGRKWESTCGLK